MLLITSVTPRATEPPPTHAPEPATVDQSKPSGRSVSQNDLLSWETLPKDLQKEWRCLHCYFLCSKHRQYLAFQWSTSIEALTTGKRAGRLCCNIILGALLAWKKHANRTLDGARIFAWKVGCDKHVPDQSVPSSIVLHWPSASDSNEELVKMPAPDVVLNLFIQEGQNIGAPGMASSFPFPFPVHCLPSGDTSSSQAFKTIRRWIDSCIEKHTTYCPGVLAKRLPKRVLELTDSHFYLREPSDAESTYACLSHCWGVDGPDLQLRTRNLEVLKDGMPITDLPRTFKEAVSICLRLDIRYIWIDALYDAEDWKNCAAAMATVYENSFITIAATRSGNSNQGCFGTNTPLSQGIELDSSKLWVCEQTLDDFPLTDFALLHENGDWPLLRRAWVFQERRLSPRVLHFTKSQLVWECNSARRSEDKLLDHDWSSTVEDDAHRHHPHGPTQHPFKYPFEDNTLDWRRAVTYYSRLSLTFDKDRLPAIAAIVERSMRVRKSDTYIAGMWAKSLLYDAAWYRHEHGYGMKRPITSAPTWSWASIRGAVQFYDVSILTSVLLLGIAYKIVGPAHVGEVEHASVQLRGPILTASLEIVQVPDASNIYVNEALYKIHPQVPAVYRQLKPMFWRFEPDYDLSSGVKPVDLKVRYPILMLWRNEREHRWFGLVLRQVSGSNFERLGLCHASYKDTPSQTNTCQNMIDALPIGSLRVI